MSEAKIEVSPLISQLIAPDLSLHDVQQIKAAVRQSNRQSKAVAGLLDEFDAKHAKALGTEASTRRALIHWALRDVAAAKEALKSKADSAQALFLLGCIAEEEGDAEEALEKYEAAGKKDKKSTAPSERLVELLIREGDLKKAEGRVADLEKKEQEGPEVLYLRGRLLERVNNDEEALDNYAAALRQSPSHDKSAFRIGLIFDRRGEDDKAIEYYNRCGSSSASYSGALMNLGLLYDDAEHYDQAMTCFQEVLKLDPNSSRAKLHLRNAEASLDMYYDEAQRKEQERMEQILRTPITDFEFSVRSRNCLTKMNIRTLGDLVEKSEAEMLGYKNFGETSLREIKEVLAAKGLRLGIRRDDTDKGKKKERLKSLQISADSKLLMQPITDFDLGIRSRKAMSTLDIQTLGDLVTKTEAEMLEVKNFGQTSLVELKQKLAELNLTLKPSNI